MDIFTHLVVGALMYALFFQELTIGFWLYALFFAILPDLDLFLSPLRRKFKSNYLEHRSGSHSYIIGALISAIIGVICSLITGDSFFIFWIIGTTFYGLHVSLDLLNTTKIPCFYPFSKKEYCFYVEKAGSSFTLLTSLIFIAISLIGFNLIQDGSIGITIFNLYAIFTGIYYIYRIVSTLWIKSRLTENIKYLPGIFPIIYYLFDSKIENNTIILNLEKKSHFSGNKLLYKNNSTLSSQEMGLFKKGIQLCKKEYYYAKWTFLPKFFRKDGIFSVRFYFLETMMHLRAMYIQFDFDAYSEDLIQRNQKYEKLL